MPGSLIFQLNMASLAWAVGPCAPRGHVRCALNGLSVRVARLSLVRPVSLLVRVGLVRSTYPSSAAPPRHLSTEASRAFSLSETVESTFNIAKFPTGSNINTILDTRAAFESIHTRHDSQLL